MLNVLSKVPNKEVQCQLSLIFHLYDVSDANEVYFYETDHAKCNIN